MTGSARAPLAGRLAQVVEAQTAIARAGLGFSAALRLVAGQARELTGASAATVVLAEDDPQTIELPVERELILRCLNSATAQREGDAVAVPVRFGGRAAAVLAAVWPAGDPPGADDVQMLHLLAGLLGPALAEAKAKHDQDFELERLAHFSTHDVVTSLPNRALISDRLRHAISVARRARTRLCVMLVELDGYADVRQQIGQALGDHLLRTAAGRIRGAVREPDTVARLNGGRFLILLSGEVTPADAGMLAQRLVQAVEQPVQAGAQQIGLRLAVGAAFYPYDGLDADALVVRAEQALADARDR